MIDCNLRKKNMREDILRNLQQEIYDRCQKESNMFGIGCYQSQSSQSTVKMNGANAPSAVSSPFCGQHVVSCKLT